MQGVLHVQIAILFTVSLAVACTWNFMYSPSPSNIEEPNNSDWSNVANIRILFGGKIRKDNTTEFFWYRVEAIIQICLMLFLWLPYMAQIL